MSVVVLVPVLGRPHRIAPTIETVRATAPAARVLFIPDPDDADELRELRRQCANFTVHAGNYAQKINHGVRVTHHDLIFFGADDLLFHDGWLEAATAHIDAGAQVVGVNDLCAARTQAGRHATHFLVTRAYAEAPTIDGTPGPLYEGYDHSCVDDELVEVARHRGALVIDPSIVVEHLHPDAGKAPIDDTYRRGRAQIRKDRRRLRARRPLWTPASS